MEQCGPQESYCAARGQAERVFEAIRSGEHYILAENEYDPGAPCRAGFGGGLAGCMGCWAPE
jgi:hypothetical protein